MGIGRVKEDDSLILSAAWMQESLQERRNFRTASALPTKAGVVMRLRRASFWSDKETEHAGARTEIRGLGFKN